MSAQGFLHNKLDVKVLILYILARIEYPLPIEDIYEVAYQDDSLNYFVLAESLPELVETGHLEKDDKNRYSITEKGITHGSYTEDSLAAPVQQKVSIAIEKKINQIQRDNIITTEVRQEEDGKWTAFLRIKDQGITMLNLGINVPDEELGKKMAANMKKESTLIYKTIMDAAMKVEKWSDIL